MGVMIKLSVCLRFPGPSVPQSNGSTLHAHVSYPGNLTHRGKTAEADFKIGTFSVPNENFTRCCFFCRHILLRLRSNPLLPAQLPTVAADTQTVPDEETFRAGERANAHCAHFCHKNTNRRARSHLPTSSVSQLFLMQLLVGLIQQVCRAQDSGRTGDSF